MANREVQLTLREAVNEVLALLTGIELEYDPAQENSFAPALCNRIDRNTGGLVLCAKNAMALQEMNEIIKQRHIWQIW